MPLPVVSGATVQCTMGTTPGQLKASPSTVRLGGAHAVRNSDVAPMMSMRFMMDRLLSVRLI